jgi:hypothetical protein
MSLSHNQSHVWSGYVVEISSVSLICSSAALTFLTNISEERKSASHSAIQVKNRRKTIGIEGKLHVMEKVNEL